MRYVPDLAFLPDDSMERGQHILSLIDHERDDTTI
jgi:ribosome-binding factor A